MPQYDDPLWTIIVLLVIVLAAVWANSREQSRRANGRSDPEKPKEDTSRSPDIKRPPDTYTSRTDANDRGNTEKAIRNWTMVLAIATAIGSVFALFTLNAIRGQLDEMQADQRPWLSVTVKPVGQMIFHDNKEVSISLSVISKNFGRSPARRIEIVPEIHAVTEKNLREVAYRLFQDHTCERAKLVSLDNRVGKTVFPTDTKEIQVGTLGEIPENPWPDAHNISLIILGCVDYLYGGGNLHGQTRFKSYLGLSADGGIHMRGIDPNVGVLRAEDLKTEEDVTGNYAE